MNGYSASPDFRALNIDATKPTEKDNIMTTESKIAATPWVKCDSEVRDKGGKLVARIFGDNDQMDESHVALIAAAPELLKALKCAFADLEGIMPEFEPSGDREHPAWKTIEQARAAIAKATE